MKPKLIFLCKFIPEPTRNGWAIRNKMRLGFLCKYYEVYVVWFSKDHSSFPELNTICSEIISLRFNLGRYDYISIAIARLFLGKSFFISKYFSSAMKNLLISIIKQHNIKNIFVSELAMWQYMSEIKIGGYFFDNHNIEHLLINRLSINRNFITRWIIQEEWRRIKLLEDELIKKSNLTFLVSDTDKNYLQSYIKNRDMLVVKNTYENTYWYNNEKQYNDTLNLFFIWNLSWYPNVSWLKVFLKNVFPDLIIYFKWKIILHILWSNICSEINWYKSDNVYVYSNVTNDFKSVILKDWWLGLVPLLVGSWTRIKIIEYRSFWLPVLSTILWSEWLIWSEWTITTSAIEDFKEIIKSIGWNKKYLRQMWKKNYLHYKKNYDPTQIFTDSLYFSITSKRFK